MRKTFILSLLLTGIFLIGCTQRTSHSTSEKSTTTQVTDARVGENLDLTALGELVNECTSAKDLEKKLNESDGINNLDLDEDGYVDYLKVTSYGKSPNIGFSFCAVLSDGEPEVCTIEVDETSKQVTISGNESYYGSGHHYTSSYVGRGLLYYALMPGYSHYYSPYYYGGVSPFYRPYAPVAYASYSTRSSVVTARSTSQSKYTKSTTAPRSQIASPNKSNVSKKATASSNKYAKLSGSKSSKKSFEKRDANKKIDKGGFTKKKPSSSQDFTAKKKANSDAAAKKKSTTKKKSSWGSSSKSSSSKKSGGSKRRR